MLHYLPLVGGVILALVAFLVIRHAVRRVVDLRVVVPTNMVHIVQRGKTTTSYGKDCPAGNVYYAWGPHMPIIGVSVTELPVSVFTVELNNYEAYDAGRLPFKVDVRAFFRIVDSDTAAHRVSHFPQLEEQLTAVLQGAVRRVLAINSLENIMQDRAKLGADFTSEVDPQLAQWGVEDVKSIEFMDIRDHDGSQVIANIMAKEKSRIEKESRIVVAANMQDAQTREVEAAREVQLRKTEAEQQVGQRQAAQQQAVGIAQQQAQQEVASEAKTTAEREMAVKLVNDVQSADIARQVAEVAALQAKNVAITQADASREVAARTAEGEKSKLEIVAEGALTHAKKSAEGIQAQGLAKAEAEKALQLAPVAAQISLAKEIGENKGYQEYLIGIRKVEANQAVGVEQAKALAAADIRVIANGGTVSGGIASISDILSPGGGLALGSALEGFAETPVGAAVMRSITSGEAKAAKKANGAS